MQRRRLFCVLLLVLWLTGCVGKSKYDDLQKQFQQTRTELDQTRKQRDDLQRE